MASSPSLSLSSSSLDSSNSLHWHYSELDDHNFQIRGHTLFYAVLLFSIILILTLLLLYARWVCTFHRLLPISSSSSSTPPPPPPPNHHGALPPLSGYSRGLDAESIAGIPIVMYRKGGNHNSNDNNNSTNDKRESDEYQEEEGGEECSICLGVVEDGEKVKVLPWCGHCYHSECVDRWLFAHSVCPLCRGRFTPTSKLTGH